MCNSVSVCLFISEIILTYIPLSGIISDNFKELSYIDKFENLRIKTNFDDINNRFLYLSENTNVNKKIIKFEEYLQKYNLKEGDLFIYNKDIKDALKQTYNKSITFIVFSILFITNSFIIIIYSGVKEMDEIFGILMISNYSSRTLIYLILTIVDGVIKGISSFSIDFREFYIDNFFGFNNDFYNYYIVISELNSPIFFVYFLLLTIFNMIVYCIYCYHFSK